MRFAREYEFVVTYGLAHAIAGDKDNLGSRKTEPAPAASFKDDARELASIKFLIRNRS